MRNATRRKLGGTPGGGGEGTHYLRKTSDWQNIDVIFLGLLSNLCPQKYINDLPTIPAID